MKPSEIFCIFVALTFKEGQCIQEHLLHEQYICGLRKFLMGCRTCHLCASSSDVVHILLGSTLITSDNTLMAFMLFQLIPGGDAPTSQKHSHIMNANSTRGDRLSGGKGWRSSWEESPQSLCFQVPSIPCDPYFQTTGCIKCSMCGCCMRYECFVNPEGWVLLFSLAFTNSTI